MKNINLIEILKNAPVGKIKLYSVLHGKDLIFGGISDSNKIQMLFNDKEAVTGITEFFSNGSWFKDGDCVLFPDKQKHDWENWHYWLFRYSIGSVIIDQYQIPYLFNGDCYYPRNPKIYGDIIRDNKMDLTNSRYATREETECYFNELTEYGFTYNRETNKVEELKFQLIPGKYYICVKDYSYKESDFKTHKVYTAGKKYLCHGTANFVNNFGNISSISREMFKEHFRQEPWSLNDAKPGDVLVNEYNSPFIFYNKDDKGIYAFCGLLNESNDFFISNDTVYWISTPGGDDLSKVHPASNDEKEKLFITMNKAGYKWGNYKLEKINKPKKKKKCDNPEIGMLVKLKSEYYSDPFNMHDKEEYLSRIYIITDIGNYPKDGITLAPITTRSVVTLDFYCIDNACPIHIDKRELTQQYYIVEESVIYDVKFLKTWDKVLVKNLNNEEWKIAQFSHLRMENGKYMFICDNGRYNICIPYNRATSHLVGTKDTPIPIYDMKIN